MQVDQLFHLTLALDFLGVFGNRSSKNFALRKTSVRACNKAQHSRFELRVSESHSIVILSHDNSLS